MASVTMTKDTHEATVEDGIVFIDFWAAWCGPCRAFAPVFEQASETHPDITFAKVDTDVERELAGMYGISSIPTLVIYRDNIPVYLQPGAMGAPQLEDLIRQVRALDMDSVRAQYEQQRAAAGQA